MKLKKYMALIPKTLIGLTLIIWSQFSIYSAQADCTPYSPKSLETMDSIEPLIINESLTSLNENEVKPFNSDIQSIVVFKDFIDFDFRPHSLISLSALQKAFGNYTMAPTRTNRTGSVTTYTIVFRVDLNGKNVRIIVDRISPDLTVEKIEITEISIAYQF
jgi:hypothetical protein